MSVSAICKRVFRWLRGSGIRGGGHTRPADAEMIRRETARATSDLAGKQGGL